MERFSYIAPTGRPSLISISNSDKVALSRIETHRERTLKKHRLDVTVNARGSGSTTSTTEDAVHNKVPEFKPGSRFYAAFSALAALSLVVALDGTSISVALPVIAQALEGSATDAFWAGTSFLLSSTITQPIYASLSSVFGRKQLALIAVTFFLAGTLFAATARNMAMMLVGRSVQGIGGGGIVALTNILITDLVPLRHRGNWLGILGAMWAIGSVSGPVVGGALSHPNTWSWIFYLNVPFIVISFALVAMFIQLKPVSLSLSEKVRRADWGGSFIFAASMTSIMIPMTWGGVEYEWQSWRTIAPLGFGLCGFIILAYHEKFVAVEPVITTKVFANRNTNIAYMTTALHGMVLWCLLYYQPLYFEGVRGFSPVIAGVALFPASFTVAPTAIVIGLVISRFGTYRWAIWVGWGLTTAGVGLCCLIKVDTTIVQIVHTDLITGIGLGILFPALQFQLQSASDGEHIGTAVAMFAFFRGLGQTLGIAIGGNIFQNALSDRLSKEPIFAADANTLAEDATAVVQWMATAPDGEPRTAMRLAYTDSLRTVYIVMACFALVATLASLTIKHYDLDRALETDQYLVEGDKQTQASRSAA